MWSLIVGVLVVLCVYLVVPVVLDTIRRRRVLLPVPGLEQTCVLGHVKHFMNKPPPVILETVQRAFRECGTVWKTFLLHETLVFVSDPKIMEVSGGILY